MALTLSENPPELYAVDTMVPVDSDVGALPILLQMASDYDWFVAETRSRAEKSLARNLVARDIPYFLPYSRRITGSRNRVFTPLLPGFVFVAYPRGDEARKADVKGVCLETEVVWGFIDAKDQNRLRLDLLILAGKGVTTEEVIPALLPGLKAKVVRGPLAGVEGVIVGESGGRVRLLLTVQLLNQPVSLSFDPQDLEAVHDDCVNPGYLF